MKSWFWGLALLVVAVAILALAWTPSREMSAAVGWILIALGVVAIGFRLFLSVKGGSKLPLDPMWKSILSSVGIILIGIENVWPQYQVARIGFVLTFAMLLFDCFRRYRETNGESIF